MLLSIIIPVYNESQLVATLLDRVRAVDFSGVASREIIIIDDGSTDGTIEVLQDYVSTHSHDSVRLIAHEENQGKGAAVRTGMRQATGDIIIIQDSDLEYDPGEIPDVIAPIIRGEARVVYGSRILKEKAIGQSGHFGFFTGKHPDSYLFAYLGGVTVTKWTNLWTGAKLTDEPTCYKCFHREALHGITIVCDDFSWEPEITVKLLTRGIPIHEVPISYHPRSKEEGKKINWKHGIAALWTVIDQIRKA
jgi:glycosyltransferase involved in cell wall biosynthesis